MDRKCEKNIYLDNSLSRREKAALFLSYFIRFLNYITMAPFFGARSWIGFVSVGATLECKRKIKIGKWCNIENNTYISGLSLNGIEIGRRFTLKRNSIINCTGTFSNLGLGIKIGNNVGISENCVIYARGLIEIGDNVIIGPGTIIVSENHNYDAKGIPVRYQKVTRRGISIGNGTWVGANVKILDGVNIGQNSVIAAGSVVTKSIPDGAFYAGVPAKKIGN